MGLAMPSLRFLACEHKRKPFRGPVLTLGRQSVHATYDQVQAMLVSEAVEPRPLPQGLSLDTNIPSWRHGPNARFTSDKVFFLALAGLDVFALDVSDFEGADYVWDLNVPVPHELEAKFGLIVDGGTLEHLFDVRQALQNVNRMLKPGGRVIHMNPASNYLEHGFYQFSPTLFYDYYGVNGFTELQCFIVEQSASNLYRDYNFWQWDVERPYSRLMSDSRHLLMVFFCAEKTENSTIDKIPQQSHFLSEAYGGRTRVESRVGEKKSMKQKITASVLLELKLFINRRLLKRGLTLKPWGLRWLGKL